MVVCVSNCLFAACSIIRLIWDLSIAWKYCFAISQQTESTDDFGEVILSFTTLANVWAKVVETGAHFGEGEEGNQMVATKRVEFFIRYRSDINEQMQIVHDNTTYTIEAILNADARKSFQKIVTRFAD